MLEALSFLSWLNFPVKMYIVKRTELLFCCCWSKTKIIKYNNFYALYNISLVVSAYSFLQASSIFCWTWIYVMHRIWPAFLVISLPSKQSSQGIQVIEGIMKRERDDNKKTVYTHDNFFCFYTFTTQWNA